MEMPEITKKYIDENRSINSVRRISNAPYRRKISPNRFRLARFSFRVAVSCLRISYYPFVVLLNLKDIVELRAIRKVTKRQNILLLGNGPSLGYVDCDSLDAFRDNGGITVGINFWPSMRHVQAHAPDWLVFSDPETFNTSGEQKDKALALINYVNEHPFINILVPFSSVRFLRSLFRNNKVYGFCDLEVAFNLFGINIFTPRSYVSMTLYKALAFSIFLSPKCVYLLGMDNNYFRKIVNDHSNNLASVSQHPDYELLFENSEYSTMGLRLLDYARNFLDLEQFPTKNILNLDVYSLTDRFKKANIPPNMVRDFLSKIDSEDQGV